MDTAFVMVAAAGLVVTSMVAPLASGDVAQAAESAATPCDFDGDGYADLTVGVPGEDLRGKRDAGAVQVIYGSASGPTARDQMWHQGRRGVKGTLERNDHFGDALACGDFDADGYVDLAIGIPDENVGSIVNAGAVQVLYGGPRGLTARDQVWHQGKKGVPGSNERDDSFGFSVAAGDFDADGYADLAIGVPGEGHHGARGAGRVVVLRGAAGGLTSAGAQNWRESVRGIGSEPSPGEQFGTVLAAGDVDGDGRDDLAIATGVGQSSSTLRRGVHVLRGGSAGLSATGGQFLVDAPELTRDCAEHECGVPFGGLVLADFNDDGRADLGHAVIPGLSVVVRYARDAGFGSGPTAAVDVEPGVDQSWAIGPDDGLREEGGEGARAGAALAAGDLTGDGIPDLAIGAPGWEWGTGYGVGTVFVVPGSRTVMPANVGQSAEGSRAGALLGSALTILPLGGPGSGWLVMGAPGDTTSGRPAAGSVLMGPGEATPCDGGCSTWHQDSPGIKGTAEAGDQFGFSLAG